MGYNIAMQSFYMGARVIAISGPTNIKYPNFIEVINVESADDMLYQSLKFANITDIFISCAAVADYKPTCYSAQKIKKSEEDIIITFKKNPDIISQVKKQNPKLFSVAFAAETNNVINNAKIKFKTKSVGMIAVNDVSNGQVFDKEHNELTVVDKNGEYHIPYDTKNKIAKELLKLIVCRLN